MENERKSVIPKHIIIINGIEFSIGNDININYDMDKTYYTGSFSLPNIDNITLRNEKNLTNEEINKSKNKIFNILNNLEYGDSLLIYYKEFETFNEYYNAKYSDMDLIVDGYISDVITNENKDDTVNQIVHFKSTMGLSYDNTLPFDLINYDCANTILGGLAELNMIPKINKEFNKYLTIVNLNKKEINSFGVHKYIYDFTKIQNDKTKSWINKIIFDDFTASNYFIPKINVSTNFGQSIDTIKTNHSIKIFQYPDGTLNVTTPGYFYNETADVLQFDLKTNVQNVDFGGLNNLYNSVVVYGTGCTGFAFDPISYELGLPEDEKINNSPFDNTKPGLKVDKYRENFKPKEKYLRIKYLFRRDILDSFTAYNVAINELYNISKDATITFETIYNKNIRPGMFFNLKNSKYLRNKYLEFAEGLNKQQKLIDAQKKADEQIWIIKKVKLVISKENIGVTVIGYKNAIVDFPARYIVPSDSLSLLDRNLLGSITKEKNNLKLH